MAKQTVKTEIKYTRKRQGRTDIIAVPRTQPTTWEDMMAVLEMIRKDVFGW